MPIRGPIAGPIRPSISGPLAGGALPWGESGGQPALVPPPGNLYDWYPPDGIDLATPQWLDRGPNGNHLTKVFANNPTSGIAIDGRASVTFGTASALKNVSSSLAQPFTSYVVVRCDETTSTNLIHDGHTGTNRVTLYTNSSAQLTAFAGTNLNYAGGWRRGTVHAVRFTANGASSEVYITDLTGTPVASGNAGAGTWGGLTLGAGNTGSNAWSGEVAELIRYSGAHDSAAVAAYLLRKYPSIAKRAWTPYDMTCLGDSITVGTGSTDGRGFRSLLFRAFEVADVNPGVTALRFNGATNDSALNHFGTSGAIISDKGTTIAAELAARPADLLVCLIGTNDCRDNGTTYDPVTTPAAYATLLENVRVQDSGLPVIVCTVPPLTNSTHNANVDDLNDELTKGGGVIAVQQGLGQSITVCDLNSAITTADLGDGVHPNDAGYAKIAAALEASIRAVA